jgi:predicted enzyme related to lactoylglutathione lyase
MTSNVRFRGIAVDDIKQHMKKVKEAGGELLGEPAG